jgi:hypothetical protein
VPLCFLDALVVSLLIRLILGLVFVVGGLFSYFGNTDINPVTGEKQRVQLTPRQEVVLGLESRQQMAARMSACRHISMLWAIG